MSFVICSNTNLLTLQTNYHEIYQLYESTYQLLLSKLTLLASHPESYHSTDISEIESVITQAYWKHELLFRFHQICLAGIKHSKYLSFTNYRYPESLTFTTKKTTIACHTMKQLGHQQCPQDNSKAILEITLRNKLSQTSPTIFKIGNATNQSIPIHSNLTVLSTVPSYLVQYHLPGDSWKDCQFVYEKIDGTKETFTLKIQSLSLGLNWLLFSPQTSEEIQWNQFILQNAIRSIETNITLLHQSRTLFSF